MNKGILYIILSGLSFIVVNFFVKLLGTDNVIPYFGDLQEYPAHELVLARSIVSFVISFSVIKMKKIPVLGNNKKWLLVRGITGTIALTIFFYTIHYLPLVVASIIQYLAPIFTVILTIFILGEKVKKLQWFFIGLSFTGVLLIMLDKITGQHIDKEELSLLWLGLGVVSAAFSGLAYTAIVKLKNTDQPITIVFYFPMIAIPVMLILCIFDFTMPRGIEWFLLLIIGIFTQFAQILLTKALHEGSASTITPFQYLGAIYSFIIGYYIFGEVLSPIVTIGAILVVSGVFINALLKRR